MVKVMSAVEPSTLGPVAARERYEVLDVVRGFALLGILVVNLNSFNGWYFMSTEQKAALPTTELDAFLSFLQQSFIVGKFYTLFSLLFGIGFAIQFSRADGTDSGFRRRYARRLLILIGFGLLHFCLWSGDILALYALCGFLLILFRNAADRLLLTLAAILILLPVPYYGAMWLSDGRLDPSSPLWELGMGAAAALDIPNADIGQGALLPVLKNGGFFDQLRVAYPNALMRYGEIIFEGRMFKVFGVFLIGLWVGRRLGAVSILDDTHMLRRVFWIGLLVGLPANLLLGALTMMGGTWPYSGLGLAQTAVGAVGVVPLALAYAAGFAMLWQRSSSQRYIGWLAPVGRLALTNYIGQTVFGVVLFFGTGLGLMGTMGAFVTTVLALVFFSAQTGMSIWWSRRFRFGPLEWVWRQLTYGKRFPIRHHVVKPTGAG